MPIIWRYFLSQYTKVFFLALFSFIAILLVTRMDEIAQFTALAATPRLIGLFALYQVMYILPIALPISTLLSSIILYQKLSASHEITALRSSGMSIRYICAPVLTCAAVLSFVNFYIVSEAATASHLSSRQMINELKTINPLILLQNKQLLKLQDAHVEMGALYSGEVAHDVIIALSNHSSKRINLVNAKKLHLSSSILFGEDVAFISSLNSENSKDFDHLFIENHKSISTPSNEFSMLLKKTGWRLSNDHLRLSLLLIRAQNYREEIARLGIIGASSGAIKGVRGHLNRTYSEISRRFSAAIAVFSFTLMGMAFGITIGRKQTRRGTAAVILLAAFFLFCFFAGKSFEQSIVHSVTLYLLPHALIISLSIMTLKRTTRGIE